jgi:hypothetical protein
MILQRANLGEKGKPTFGLMTSRDGKFECVTLERSHDDAEHPCIPQGVYHVTEDWHHPTDLASRYRCPELLDVPGRSQIQLHIGNVCGHSLGCILIGERVGDDCIEASGAAFKRLMEYLKGAALPWTLEVRDP